MRSGARRAVVRVESLEEGHRRLIEIEIDPERRDRVQLNRQNLSRTQDLLESLRVTLFTPDDLVLVKGGPKERRDFLDGVLLAARPSLAPVLQTVERALRQRATLLRQAAGRRSAEVLETLDVWDAQLAAAGTTLVEAREELTEDLRPHVGAAFTRLTGVKHPTELGYRRSFEGPLLDALERARDEDLRRQVNSVGPHRDDLDIAVGDLDARTRLSQGRQRCMTLSLRLGGHRLVTERVGSAPVVLLDDAFSELDDRTATALVHEIVGAQALLTTAGPLPTGAHPSLVVSLRDGTIES